VSSTHHLQAGYRFWRRRAGTTTTVFGAVALAALGLCGGLGGWLGGPHQSGPPPRRIPVLAIDTSTSEGTSTSQGASTSQGTSTSQPPSTPSQRSAPVAQTAPIAGTAPLGAADQQLLGALPPGYDTNACQPVTPPVTGALSTMDCFNNANGGPPFARYSLFADPQTLQNSFATITFNDVAHQTCPDGAASPGSWHFNVTPKQTAGSLICGVDSTNNNSGAVGWTDDGVLLLAVAEGPSIDALYGWWHNPDPSDPNAGRAAFP
jgi:hypothetical protein